LAFKGKQWEKALSLACRLERWDSAEKFLSENISSANLYFSDKVIIYINKMFDKVVVGSSGVSVCVVVLMVTFVLINYFFMTYMFSIV
jgi:hypothetical protein